MSTTTETAPTVDAGTVLAAAVEAANAAIAQRPGIDLDDLTSLTRAALNRQGYAYPWDAVRAILSNLRQAGRLASPLRQTPSARKGLDDDPDWWQE